MGKTHITDDEKVKVEFEGFSYTVHPEHSLKMARDMSLRMKTMGDKFTASLITEVLHLRKRLEDGADSKT